MSRYLPTPRKSLAKYLYALAGVCIVLLGTSTYYFCKYRSISHSPYPLIDIARNFIPQSDFVVNIQPLRTDLNALVAAETTASISLYFEVLNTGANISINPGLKIWPASLAKLPVAMVVMRRVDEGIWNLNDQLVATAADLNDASGNLYSAPAGTWYTIERLLTELLVHSDNTAYNILMRNLKPQELDLMISETGLEELFSDDGRVSAKEYTRILRSLYTSSFLHKNASNQILTWLSQAPEKNFLRAGLPEGALFAHKYGENTRFKVYSDSGIVYVGGRPYLLSVMIQGPQEQDYQSQAEELMKTVSEKAYQYMSTYKQ